MQTKPFCIDVNNLSPASPTAFWRAYARFLVENVKEAVIAVDYLGIITIFNVKAEQDFNLKAEDVVGQLFQNVFSYIPPHEHYLIQALKSNRELKDVEYTYCPYTEKDGAFVHNVALVYDTDGSVGGAIWMRKDRTSVRQFQREVSDAEVHAVVSQIAAGTAHEIRNPLATAKGFLQLAKQHSSENNTVSCYLDAAVEEIDQINRIITDFLALVHPQSEGLQFTNCNGLITDVLILVENVATMYNIALRIELSSDIPLCLLDTKQVKHALLNVLQNAIQAMPQGGLLHVETLFDNETEEICISISDTGKGINQENLSRIFNPFFSTKVEGSGLGLTLTNRIVTHHNGHIEISSEEGKGTTVRLCFPINQ